MKHATPLLVILSASLVAGGAVSEFTVLPRALPAAEQPLALAPGQRELSPEALAQLLCRMGRSLSPEICGDLAKAIAAEASLSGYDPLFLIALIGVESNYRLTASSERGARGVVQLKPSTFAWLAGRESDLRAHALESGDDPVTDLRLAVRYLRWLERKFQSRDEALIAYNAGPRRAAEVLRMAAIPEKYRAYPLRVRREHERVVRIFEGKEPAPGERYLLARAN